MGGLLVGAPAARRVVAEAFHFHVPDRLEPRDQQRLAERDEDVVDDQEATEEVGAAEVGGGVYRLGVFL